MTKAFDDYWTALVSRNPNLADGTCKMRITVASFKRSLEQAFDKGKASPGKSFTDIFGSFLDRSK